MALFLFPLLEEMSLLITTGEAKSSKRRIINFHAFLYLQWISGDYQERTNEIVSPQTFRIFLLILIEHSKFSDTISDFHFMFVSQLVGGDVTKTSEYSEPPFNLPKWKRRGMKWYPVVRVGVKIWSDQVGSSREEV